MNFKNIFLSFFLVLAVGLALVNAEQAKEPRGPKITHKVRSSDWSIALSKSAL